MLEVQIVPVLAADMVVLFKISGLAEEEVSDVEAATVCAWFSSCSGVPEYMQVAVEVIDFVLLLGPNSG